MQHFDNDYMEGMHPLILERLAQTNMLKTTGYGCDEICESARMRIREACGVPDAAVHFLVGGTQTNATVIRAMLRPYEGVIAADTGHISLHEAGAIEAGGHKVLTIPHVDGKLTAEAVDAYIGHFVVMRRGSIWCSQVWSIFPSPPNTAHFTPKRSSLLYALCATNTSYLSF